MEKKWYYPMIDAQVETNSLPLLVIGINLDTGMPRISMNPELPRVMREYPSILKALVLSIEQLKEMAKPPDDRAKGISISLYHVEG